MFWALKDISFKVKKGETVGFIGRNGAGKSTLLKILSRITEPTSGIAKIYGRVASLLEVGTGFHGELTGRENIYLNGAILGMQKREIERKFDEIVDFAEVEKFIETPVKRYSSGMYLRLAFAVAAHLEPEILIVDEVLAVGDASFQKKCLNKMHTVGKEGRTVLFVSHNLSAVTSLCQRAIWLNQGEVITDGPSQQTVSEYLNSGLLMMAQQEWPDAAVAPGNDIVRVRAMRLRTEDGRSTDVIDIREAVTFKITLRYSNPAMCSCHALGWRRMMESVFLSLMIVILNGGGVRGRLDISLALCISQGIFYRKVGSSSVRELLRRCRLRSILMSIPPSHFK